MSYLRTVLGDISPDQAGIVYAHEHIIIDDSFVTAIYADFRISSVEKAVEELKEVRAAGVSTMVDSMPMAAGRSVEKLAEVSRNSGVHIVCPTGLHLAQYYPPGHWSERVDAERLARLFILDITEGIDASDNNGPEFRRTEHRAGVIKVAGGLHGLDDFQERNFEAAAIAHLETGCPILTHTERGTGGLEQAQFLSARGVHLSHVVLSHLDREPDPGYHREVLSTGVCLEYDSAFRWEDIESNPTLNLILELAPEFPDQLMLGMDAARTRYWRSYGGEPGIDFLVTQFLPMLRAEGLDEALIDNLFRHNPAFAYQFITENEP